MADAQSRRRTGAAQADRTSKAISDRARQVAPMLRLLRLASRRVRLEEVEGGEIALVRPEDGVLLARLPETLLREAISRGLLTRDGDSLTASAEAAFFVKRMLAEREDEAFPVQHGERRTVTVAMADQPGAAGKGQTREGPGAGEAAGEGEARSAATDQPPDFQNGQKTHLHTVRRNLDDQPFSSVARLRDRNGKPYLPPEAVEAGERLARDFERGHLQPRITASFEPRLSQKHKGARPSGPDLTDTALAARRRVSAALITLGPDLSGVVLDICCFAKGLELVERERQWPARSAKLMLRTALLALARHYAPPAKASRELRHWGEGDYRPALGGSWHIDRTA
ncbi:DUF6456 domain-containing protein [Allorhizobium taibaishanense]|uniref:DUF6456 domain-containing protein n=1 Tax=Allorhizobium taibaishanense TaxID=887144 RepID=A0A1Q8ZZY7_9HYPH|nr:DUF6456 domain-containing protein [Allorhizobium taibaishanense]MBB4007263.1 hypothetical protein [Allorhizobium taibaishanense]OLP47740.1 hypothetical protein BJF91_05040 [Allorhizobium taibaishanense]